jgi:hypothetical protein
MGAKAQFYPSMCRNGGKAVREKGEMIPDFFGQFADKQAKTGKI